MVIKNENIESDEKEWLETILSKHFLGREEVINQINHAKIYREYTKYDLSIKFKVDK